MPRSSTRARCLAAGAWLAASLVLCAQPRAQVPPPGEPAPVAAPPDAWLARDKALHAGTSFALTAGGALALRAALDATRRDATTLAVGTTIALGVTKEIADERRPRGSGFSWRDLVADAVGTALGALVGSL